MDRIAADRCPSDIISCRTFSVPHAVCLSQGREFVMFESYDEFDKGIQERVAQAKRPMSVCAGDDGRWAAYFQGKVRCHTHHTHHTPHTTHTHTHTQFFKKIKFICR